MANLTYWQLVSLCFWFFIAKLVIGMVSELIGKSINVATKKLTHGTNDNKTKGYYKGKPNAIGFQTIVDKTKES